MKGGLLTLAACRCKRGGHKVVAKQTRHQDTREQVLVFNESHTDHQATQLEALTNENKPTHSRNALRKRLVSMTRKAKVIKARLIGDSQEG